MHSCSIEDDTKGRLQWGIESSSLAAGQSRICQAGQETAKLVPRTGSKPETRYPLDGYELYRWFRRRSRLAKTNVHITICPFLYQNTYNARKGTDSIEFLLLLFILLGSYDYPSNILCRLLFLFSLY